VETLAASLQQLVEEPGERKKLGGAARSKVQEHFNFDDQVSRLETLYGQME
jgi:glycosyltransferase involved in cell wall biosynthesis